MADVVTAARGRLGTPAVRWLMRAVMVEVGVLAITGVVLLFRYQPSSGAHWPGIGPSTVASIARSTHRLISSALLVTLLALAVVLVAARAGGGRRAGGSWAAAGAGFVFALAASFTGYLLPWDQLALTAVRANSSVRGFLPLFGSEITYALVGNSSVAVGTLRIWLVVHALVLAALVLGAAIMMIRGHHKTDQAVPPA